MQGFWWFLKESNWPEALINKTSMSCTKNKINKRFTEKKKVPEVLKMPRMPLLIDYIIIGPE
jgi:hypothetical protein